MVGMEEGLFPSARDELNEAAMEEARRLCYVGMTRAKEQLYMTYAQSRRLYGRDPQYNAPSPFLEDANGGPINGRQIQSDYRASCFDDFKRINDGWGSSYGQSSGSEPANDFGDEPHYVMDDDGLHPGDHVRHHVFGEGVVQSIDQGIVKVQFGNRTRSLNLEYARLVKL